MNTSSHRNATLPISRFLRQSATVGLAAVLAVPVFGAWHSAQAGPDLVPLSAVSDPAQDAADQTATAAAEAAAQAAAQAAQAAAEAAAQAARTWHVPVATYYVSSPFGEMRDSGPHIGLDFAGNDGKPVMAARHGVVTQAGWEDGYGFCVTIDHGDGHTTKYAHMADQPLVAAGQSVVGGQQIGIVGTTGDSTGPHLHFELRSFGQQIDPTLVINVPPSQGIETP